MRIPDWLDYETNPPQQLTHNPQTDVYEARLYYVPLEYWLKRGISFPAALPRQLQLPFDPTTSKDSNA